MLSMRMELRLEQRLESPHETAIRIHEQSPKIAVPVELGKRILHVPAALIRAEELQSIFPDEKYACTVGGLFFITRATPTQYRPFAAFHELAEHAAPRGFDITGLAAHYQAISVEMGYAKAILMPEEYERFYDWRRNVERSKYFTLRHKEIIEAMSIRIEEIFDKIPQYIMYNNRRLLKDDN